MKYLLFGTGEYYQRYKKWFAKDNIAAFGQLKGQAGYIH